MSEENREFESLVEQVLDLKGWDEHRGFVSMHAPKCPSCEEVFEPSHLEESGLALCPHCLEACHWQIVGTPLGDAWSTWVVIPGKRGEL